MKSPSEELKQAVAEYQHPCLYQFCVGCVFKTTTYREGKPIRVSCPARFNPFESTEDEHGNKRRDGRGCPRHARFMELEKRRNAYERQRLERR